MADIVAAAVLGWVDRDFDMESHALLAALFLLEGPDKAGNDQSPNRDLVEGALLTERFRLARLCWFASFGQALSPLRELPQQIPCSGIALSGLTLAS
jgi:hypothetical protein